MRAAVTFSAESMKTPKQAPLAPTSKSTKQIQRQHKLNAVQTFLGDRSYAELSALKVGPIEKRTPMTAKVITVFNQKGGCGKTTIAMSLAGTLALRGYSCLVVDMDPQGTAIRWASAAPEERAFPAAVMSLAPMEGKMHREVKNHMQTYDTIFIDCPPAMNSAAPTSAMLVSDLALIPVVPSPADIWAAESAKKLAEAAQATNESLIACVIANMVQKSTSLARDLLELLEEDKNFPLLRSSLGSRAAFREAQIIGSTVHRVPRAKAAIDEVEMMTDEVAKLLHLSRTKAKGCRS